MTHPPPIPFDRPPAQPVQPLAYSVPSQEGRPGVLTAVGIISLIVALLSGLSSLSGLAQAGMLLVMSSRTAATPSVVPAGTVTSFPSSTSATGGTWSSTTVVGLGPGLPAATQSATQPANAPAGLSSAQVQSIIQRVQGMAGNSLNPAQVSALRTALQSPSPPLVSPVYAYSPVQSASRQADGTVDIQFTGGGYISLATTGQVVSQGTAGAMTFPGFAGVSPAVAGLLGLDALASLVLAVLLFVAGILVFRSSPRASRLHRIFAVCKIPVAVAGAVGTSLMYRRMFAATPGSPLAAGGAEMLIMGSMFIGSLLMSCAYPAALLIVLRARPVRAYYASAMVA